MGRSSGTGLLIAFTVLIAALLLAFTLGRYPISVGDLIHLFVAKLTGSASEEPIAAVNVITQIRGPRVLAAALIGAARRRRYAPKIVCASLTVNSLAIEVLRLPCVIA